MLNPNQAAGFTLLEVLIATCVLAIGILGATGMQLRAMDFNREAVLRTEANQLANDIVDRVAINSGITYGPLALSDGPPSASDCRLNNCTPAQMAAFDIAQWRCAINSVDADGNSYAPCDALGVTGRLPGGTGSLERDGDEYETVVQWVDIKSGRIYSVRFVFRIDA